MRPKNVIRPDATPQQVSRAELDWRDGQYRDSGFTLELIEQISALEQMVCRVDLQSGKGLGRVGRTEQRKACRGVCEVMSGPVPDAAEASVAKGRRPQLGQPRSPW